MDALNELQKIFRDIFDDETLIISNETSENDIEQWDSLAQINIIAVCESVFKISFDINDIVTIKSVGDIINIIERN